MGNDGVNHTSHLELEIVGDRGRWCFRAKQGSPDFIWGRGSPEKQGTSLLWELVSPRRDLHPNPGRRADGFLNVMLEDVPTVGRRVPNVPFWCRFGARRGVKKQ